jgi:hypothetical protein
MGAKDYDRHTLTTRENPKKDEEREAEAKAKS